MDNFIKKHKYKNIMEIKKEEEKEKRKIKPSLNQIFEIKKKKNKRYK
jgi:hypothetical protein